MNSFALKLALTLFILAPASARCSEVADAKAALERAVYAEKTDALLEARGRFERLSQSSPKSGLMHYWVAVADWRLVPRLKDSKLAKRYCKDGLDRAEKALALDPKLAEALALQASLKGLWLRYEPQLAMSLGMEIEATMGRALAAAPENPRVAFLDALNTLHKPAFVGGGADRAAPKFERAVERFANEKVGDPAAPDWGRLDAVIWSGRCALENKDPKTALAHYERALALSPDNGWVKGALIPEAEKALAAAAPETATAESDGSGQKP